MNEPITVPSPGESIVEVTLSAWIRKDGERVAKDEDILEIESEKATLTVVAPADGVLKTEAEEGDTVEVGAIVGNVCETAAVAAPSEDGALPEAENGEILQIPAPTPGESIAEVTISAWNVKSGDSVRADQEIGEVESEKASLPIIAEKAGTVKLLAETGETVEVGKIVAEVAPGEVSPQAPVILNPPVVGEGKVASPAAAKILREKGIAPENVIGTGKGGRITKEDALCAQEILKTQAQPADPEKTQRQPAGDGRPVFSDRMSPLRKKISERLVSVKNRTAMLTTFNEVDLSAVMETRAKYKELFKTKHDVGLGYMSFFSKACCMALMEFPLVNAQIDGERVVRFGYVDLGIAVNAPKGLMVPVIRDAESKSLAEIEQAVVELAAKARESKLGMEEMTGGTFTITNGGVFGSMLSTPILNPPQSAILGMHNIVQRPVAVDGEVKIRPVMYVALSYDHRVIDGKDSVRFLFRVKELLEDPVRMLISV